TAAGSALGRGLLVRLFVRSFVGAARGWRPDPAVAQAGVVVARLGRRRQRPAVARPQEAGEGADHRLEQVVALDAALAPDAGAEAELAGQGLQDAGARLALAQVLLERGAEPE